MKKVIRQLSKGLAAALISSLLVLTSVIWKREVKFMFKKVFAYIIVTSMCLMVFSACSSGKVA